MAHGWCAHASRRGAGLSRGTRHSCLVMLPKSVSFLDHLCAGALTPTGRRPTSCRFNWLAPVSCVAASSFRARRGRLERRCWRLCRSAALPATSGVAAAEPAAVPPRPGDSTQPTDLLNGSCGLVGTSTSRICAKTGVATTRAAATQRMGFIMNGPPGLAHGSLSPRRAPTLT